MKPLMHVMLAQVGRLRKDRPILHPPVRRCQAHDGNHEKDLQPRLERYCHPTHDQQDLTVSLPRYPEFSTLWHAVFVGFFFGTTSFLVALTSLCCIVLFDHDVAGSNDKIGKVDLPLEKMQELLAGVPGKVHKASHVILLDGELRPVVGRWRALPGSGMS